MAWHPAVTTEAPTGDVVSLEDAKEYLRVDDDDQDVTIAAALAAAIAHVEFYTDTRLLTQTVRLRAGKFADLSFVPIGPIQSIASIAYLDATGASQTLDSSIYELSGDGLARGIRPAFNKSWPSTRPVDDAITVSLVVGYGDGDAVPAPIVDAIKLLLGDAYEVRSDTVLERSVTPAPMPNGVAAKLVNFRL